MHSFIIKVRRVGKFSRAGLAEVLLLVHDKVLGTSNDPSVLDTFNGLCNSHTRQNRIRAEAYVCVRCDDRSHMTCKRQTYLPNCDLLQGLCQVVLRLALVACRLPYHGAPCPSHSPDFS